MDALASCLVDLNRVQGHVSTEAFLSRLAGRIDYATILTGPEYSDAEGASDIHSLLRDAVRNYQHEFPQALFRLGGNIMAHEILLTRLINRVDPSDLLHERPQHITSEDLPPALQPLGAMVLVEMNAGVTEAFQRLSGMTNIGDDSTHNHS